MKKKTNNIEPMLLDVKGIMTLTGLGRNLAFDIGEKSGAKFKIGRRTVYDREKLEAYIKSLSQ